jgi:hypothetical protein
MVCGVFLLAAVALPRPAGAEDPKAPPARTAAELLADVPEIYPEIREDALQLLTQVQEKSLPIRPFIEKLMEGCAKKIPAGRLMQVLRKRLDTIEESAAVLKRLIEAHEEAAPQKHAYQDAELGEVAVTLCRALEQGVPKSSLDELSGYVSELSKGEAFNLALLRDGTLFLLDSKLVGLTVPQAMMVCKQAILVGYEELARLMRVVQELAALKELNENSIQKMSASIQYGMKAAEIGRLLLGEKQRDENKQPDDAPDDGEKNNSPHGVEPGGGSGERNQQPDDTR